MPEWHYFWWNIGIEIKLFGQLLCRLFFWVTKEFCDSMFSSISVKKNFFFEKPRNFMFLCVLDPDDHFMKSRLASGVWHPADKTLIWKNFNSKLFLNHWPILFKFGMKVKQLKKILVIYLKFDIFGPNESRKAVKVEIG